MRSMIVAAAVAGVVTMEAEAADVPGSRAMQETLIINSDNDTRGMFELARDRDWYRVRLENGGSYAFAGSLSQGYAAARITLRGPDGRVIKSDRGEGEFSIGLWHRAAASGVYFVELEELADESLPLLYSVEADTDLPPDSGVRTVLRIGTSYRNRFNFPQDTDWLRVPLQRGQTYAIASSSETSLKLSLLDPAERLLDSAVGPGLRLTYRARETGEHFIVFNNPASIIQGYEVLVSWD